MEGIKCQKNITFREHNFQEEILCEEINEILQKHINKIDIDGVNYKEKFEEISNEIVKMMPSFGSD